MGWTQRIADARTARDAAARRRVHRTVGWRDGMRCLVDGRVLLNFCSNDYLGLSQHADVVRTLAAATDAGSAASALVCGRHAVHAALERELADWLETPAALLFGSGYTANLAVLQALLRDGDVCVQDRLNHASLIDGARLCGATLRRYPHADAEGAARQLAAASGSMRRGAAMTDSVDVEAGDRTASAVVRAGAPGTDDAPSHASHVDAPSPQADTRRPSTTRGQAGLALLATDGVFSMDGDVAPLRELAGLARAHDALLYVDDAHGVGVLGAQGRGSVDAAGLATPDVPLRLATLGKALGTYGAVVAGDADLVGHLAETARGHVYSTALPPALAAAALAAVRVARRADDCRAHLAALVERFRDRARTHGVDLLPSATPIQAVMACDDRRALAMSQALEAAGFWVSAIRPPTVPEGRARLRVTLTALHADADVDALVDALARARDAAPLAEPDPA